jgi:hypothetical protein
MQKGGNMCVSQIAAHLWMTARALNIIGLTAGLLGALILTFWGSLGFELSPNGSPILPQSKIDIHDPRRARYALWMRIRYSWMPRIAIALISLGFLAQLLALWAP